MMNDYGPPAIIATCKQTRFHLLDDKPSREVQSALLAKSLQTLKYVAQVDIEGLSIAVHSTPANQSDITDKKRSKSKNEGVELVSDAELRLKAGVHYALVGRNGSGKSSTRL